MELNISQQPKPKKKKLKSKNRKLFNPDFSNYDTDTGSKIAEDSSSKYLANMEAASEARKTRRSPYNKEETLKDAATGGSLSYLVGRAMNLGDSKKLKFLTSSRKHGILGLGAAGVAAALSVKKQKGDYNRQQAAREFVAGKETGRSSAYKKYLKSKYKIEDK